MNSITGTQPLSLQDIPKVVRIHQDTLPESPLVQLGGDFLRKIYYPCLIDDFDSFGFVYFFEGKPVGFICGTLNQSHFLGNMFQGHWIRLPYFLLRDLSKNFQSLKEIFHLLFDQTPKQVKAIQSQLLSFAILPEFRSPEFYKTYPIKIANLLFQTAVDEFKRRGVRVFQLVTDKKNLSNIFYRNAGMEMIPSSNPQSPYWYYVGKIANLSEQKSW